MNNNDRPFNNIKTISNIEQITNYILNDLFNRMKNGYIKNNRKYILQLHTNNKKTNKLRYITVSFTVNIDIADNGHIYLDMMYNTDFRKMGKFAGMSYKATSTSIGPVLHNELSHIINNDLVSSLSNFDDNMDIHLEIMNWG